MMNKLIAQVSAGFAELQKRILDLLDARAERQVVAWGATLQYRRRYTNPDVAKLARRPQ